jgi:Rrf2 family transcriptional regulator, iron-sulfur cluster assembly transcription factor
LEVLKRNSDYALRALVHLARLETGELASARVISRAERVPEPLLRKLLQKLCRAGLVASHRGVHGGFSLARPARGITALQVVEVMQGKLAVNRCFAGKNLCRNQSRCRLSDKLAAVQEGLVDAFNSVTLSDLASEDGRRGGRKRAGPKRRKGVAR